MPKLVRQVIINASKERVWEVLADFGGVSNWAPTILESHSTTEANGGVGAERTCRHEKMGNIEERVVAWEDGGSLSYDVTKGLPFPMKSLNNTWSVNAAGDSATVSVAMDSVWGWGHSVSCPRSWPGCRCARRCKLASPASSSMLRRVKWSPQPEIWLRRHSRRRAKPIQVSWGYPKPL